MIGNACNIVAPVCSVREIEPLLQAGVGEIYFGVMPDKWIEKYGNADFISRRQNEHAHLADCNDFPEIVRIVNDYGCTSTLVLNTKYSEKQLPDVFDLLEQWESRGGHSVMVSDLEILLWLDQQNSRMKRQLSVMAGTFNKHSVDFFRQFNISRVVLPREMSVRELCRFMEFTDKTTEYEAIVLFQKCEYIDAFCRFYHSVDYRSFIVTDYAGRKDDLPVIAHDDPDYEGHGCRMEFICNNKRINHSEHNDFRSPACAACSLETLRRAGISNFKIAGRGYPPELIIKAARFIKQTLANHFASVEAIQSAYRSTFGNDCRAKYCYYR